MMHRTKDGVWESPALIPVDQALSLPQMVFARAAARPDDVVAERRVAGYWHEVTAAQFAADVNRVARGFIGFGLKPGDRIGILAATSYEWAVVDMAGLAAGLVTVPIYESDSAAQIRHILRDAEVKLVVTQTTRQADLVDTVRTRGLRHVFSLDNRAVRRISAAGQEVDVDEVRERTAALDLSDLATVIYTSGTTGKPKGVMLTQGNFVASLLQAYDILPNLINDPNSRNLLFLPVAHVLARFVMYGILIGQGRIGFAPDVRHLVEDIQGFKPTQLLAVPRVLEKVYNVASQKAGSGIKRGIFSWSSEQARRMSAATAYPDKNQASHLTKTRDDAQLSAGPSPLLKLTHRAADALVLGKVREVLGPNLETVICGGAPLPPDLANFYRGIGVTLLQGYGLSETTGPITVEIPGDNPPDSVGYLWPGNSLKIASDGELLLRGISVSPGYLNLPKVTKEEYRDGWFHTGDLAETDAEGRLKITGRKKELIVTAGGKNVSPDVLQSSLISHPLISQVVVLGDDRPYISAMVTLDAEMLPTWLKNKGLAVVPPEEAAALPEVRESLERALQRANQEVSRAESIRRYRILNMDFTIENGYLTPSLKLKRHKVLADMERQINELYSFDEDELAAVGGSVTPSA